MFQKAQCLDNQVEILFKGECERCLANPCLSKRNSVADKSGEQNDSLFVCDQGGETKSKCEFDVLRCIYEIKFGYNITSAYVSLFVLRKINLLPINRKI